MGEKKKAGDTAAILTTLFLETKTHLHKSEGQSHKKISGADPEIFNRPGKNTFNEEKRQCLGCPHTVRGPVSARIRGGGRSMPLSLPLNMLVANQHRYTQLHDVSFRCFHLNRGQRWSQMPQYKQRVIHQIGNLTSRGWTSCFMLFKLFNNL